MSEIDYEQDYQARFREWHFNGSRSGHAFSWNEEPGCYASIVPTNYPPALTGLRGSHDGSNTHAHSRALDGRTDWGPTTTLREEYDLIVVGGGISGLSAALSSVLFCIPGGCTKEIPSARLSQANFENQRTGWGQAFKEKLWPPSISKDVSATSLCAVDLHDITSMFGGSGGESVLMLPRLKR